MNKVITQTRPCLHFTPPVGWMNDPNGLVFHNGEYHLFYQHHPHDLKWGPMHWGHAVSTNLIDWEHLPIALYPGEDGTIFSGSSVIDTHNTAGFGAGAMIAIYTLFIPLEDDKAIQNQGIAFSLDDGRTWTKYSNNPIIQMPAFENHNNFRDPNVSWYGTPEDGHWTMILTVHDEVWLYTSPDLKNWELASTFGRGYGCHDGVWECPDLFELPIEGGDERLWVMIVSVERGAPAGGNGVQYFLGHFDGKTFTPAEDRSKTRWVDYGPDFYAAVTYNNAPDGRRILVGWMNNWSYSHDIPAEQWRGMQSFPRELTLTKGADGLVLNQRPVRELDEHLSKSIKLANVQVDGTHPIETFAADIAEYKVTFEMDQKTSADSFGLRVRCGNGNHTTIGYSVAEGSVYVDRSKMGVEASKMTHSSVHQAPVNSAISQSITLNVIVDHESVEVWANDGEVYLTELNYPLAENIGFELFATGGEIQVLSAVCKTKE